MGGIRGMAKGIVLAMAALVAPLSAAAQELPIIPVPQRVTAGAGSMTIANGTGIAADPRDRGATTAARLLAERVAVDRGLALVPGTAGPIRFVRDRTVAGDEAYRLTIDATGAVVAASGDRGLVWGAMTLAQLASPDARFGQPVTIAGMTIDDAPRFGWRGLMMDVARHFQPVETLYRVVDAMAAQKLNVLHLHLTDDQGWRVEIKRYPDLARIGGFRTVPTADGSTGAVTGGYYTQDALKALVAHAAERGITIVPEINVPGHAQAAIAAYPHELGVMGVRPTVGNEWGITPWLVAPDARGMAFLKHVLDEVVAIFPSRYIHLGGDEAIKDQWQRSPAVQAQMKALGLTTENQLQGWMTAELARHLERRGRRLIGWDEILEGDVPTSASVMSWRGEKGAVEAANKGHDVVLSPAPNLYVNYLQSGRADEQAGPRMIQTLEAVYGYDPAPAGIPPERMHHVLGAQANAWSEYLATPEQKEHAVFPRLSAVAEFTWSPRDRRDWRGFVARLDPQMLRYRRQGIAAADSAFAVNFTPGASRGQAVRSGRMPLTLDTQTGAGTIRYTTDGSAPTPRSTRYAGPIMVAPGQVVTAAAFQPDGRTTAVPRRFDASRTALLSAGASDLVACPDATLAWRVPLVPGQAANAPLYDINIFDPCTRWTDAPLQGTRRLTIDAVRLPRHYALAHDASALHMPYAVTPHGELVVRSGGCEGTVLGTFPLPDPATARGPMRFATGFAAQPADADLCFRFTGPLSGPLYAVERAVLD